MPKQSDFDDRYAAAQASSAAAKAAHEAAIAQSSAEYLRRLERQSVEQRFDAIGNNKIVLTDADRRALVESIRNTAPANPAAAHQTARRLDIWRSRLRYRRFSVVTAAVTIVVTLTLAAVAEHRTPIQWVQVNSTQDVDVLRADLAGRTMTKVISSGQRYAVIGFAPNIVHLRDWSQGRDM